MKLKDWFDLEYCKDIPDSYEKYTELQMKAVRHNLKYYLILVGIIAGGVVIGIIPGTVALVLGVFAGFLYLSKPGVKFTIEQWEKENQNGKDETG